MNTIAAERIEPLAELLALARTEPVHIVSGEQDCLVVLSPEAFARLAQGESATVTNIADEDLLRALRTWSPDPLAPDYDPWADEPHLRPAE